MNLTQNLNISTFTFSIKMSKFFPKFGAFQFPEHYILYLFGNVNKYFR